MSDNHEDIERCPKCKSEVASGPECPTYPNRGTMYRCMPVCGNAWEYWCTNNNCDWAYIEGLNAMSPRYDANLRNKPSWIQDNSAIA